MRVKYDRQNGRLHLEPESPGDEVVLQWIIDDDLAVGAGYGVHPHKILHCQVAIQEQDDE